MMKAESLISDSVILRGMVRPDAAASGSGEAKEGLVDKYVFRGFAWSETVSQRNEYIQHTQATHLHSCLQGKEGIPRIAHFEDASKPIFRQVSNFQDLQVRGHRAQIQLIDKNIINDDRGLGRFVQRCGEELLRTRVKGGVCSQRRPIEVERHSGACLAGSCIGWIFSSKAGLLLF
jgi:hypothetical protein